MHFCIEGHFVNKDAFGALERTVQTNNFSHDEGDLFLDIEVNPWIDVAGVF